MPIINTFLSKYFYSCIGDKEYILTVNEFGNLHSCSYSERIGKILVDFFNNVPYITEIMKKYIDVITNTHLDDEEKIQQCIINHLKHLHIELSQLDCDFLHYINFENFYPKQYQQMFEIKHNNSVKSLIEPKYINIHNLKDLVLKKLTELIEKIEIFENTYTLLLINEENSSKIDKSIEKYKLTNNFCITKSYCEFVKFNQDRIIFNQKSNQHNYKLMQYFEINGIMDLINLSFVQCINNNVNINRCMNCGKYFLPSQRSDEKYCDNISPQKSDKTCKEIGSNENIKQKIKSSRIEREHHNAKTYFNMNKKRAKTEEGKEEIIKIYTEYKANFNEYLAKYQKQKITEDEFVKWIQKQKNLIKK